MKSVWRVTLIYFGIILLIVYLADKNSLNTDELRQYVPFFDKIAHFILMGMAGFLLNLSLACKIIHYRQQRFLWGSVIVGLLVTLEEFSQLYFPARSFDLLDLTADYLGIYLFGQWALLWHGKHLRGVL
jgi:VanZ family protein